MHIMEDEGSKPSAALDNLPKTNGSPTPCQNPVPALDGEKKGACGQENVATVTSKDEVQQKGPSCELPETSKTVEVEVEVEEGEIHKDKDGTAKLLYLVLTVTMV
jgi:hypothetical protein